MSASSAVVVMTIFPVLCFILVSERSGTAAGLDLRRWARLRRRLDKSHFLGDRIYDCLLTLV